MDTNKRGLFSVGTTDQKVSTRVQADVRLSPRHLQSTLTTLCNMEMPHSNSADSGTLSDHFRKHKYEMVSVPGHVREVT